MRDYRPIKVPSSAHALREGVKKKTEFIWDFVPNYGLMGPKVGPKSQTL